MRKEKTGLLLKTCKVFSGRVSEGLVSDILHYKKGLSKETIRILSEKFKLNQQAFNRPYELHIPSIQKVSNAKMMKTRKNLQLA